MFLVITVFHVLVLVTSVYNTTTSMYQSYKLEQGQYGRDCFENLFDYTPPVCLLVSSHCTSCGALRDAEVKVSLLVSSHCTSCEDAEMKVPLLEMHKCQSRRAPGDV